MFSESFDRAFRRLVSAFKRHQDVPRNPEDVVALGAARITLDEARREMALERDHVAGRRVRPRVDPRTTSIPENEWARLQIAGYGLAST